MIFSRSYFEIFNLIAIRKADQGFANSDRVLNMPCTKLNLCFQKIGHVILKQICAWGQSSLAASLADADILESANFEIVDGKYINIDFGN